jgi:hypothetical protein
MDRRSALRSFVILSAGIAFIPACKEEKVKGTVSLKNLHLSADEEMMLANLSETIVPVKAEAPADAAHYFVLAMVDDCFSKEDQQKFLEGMKQFDELANNKFGKPFVRYNDTEKKELLEELEGKKDSDRAVNYFYNTTRSLTVQHFMTSKYYLVNVRKFEMAPGRFSGCFPVEKKSA